MSSQLAEAFSFIKEDKHRYKFNCPYCNDTKPNAYLYKDSFHFHCYKCNKHVTWVEFAKDLNIDLPDIDKIERIISLNKLSTLNLFLLDELNTFGFDREFIKEKLSLTEFYKDNRSYRFISNSLFNKFKPPTYFLYSDDDKFIYVLNINDKTKKVIGLHILNLKNFGKHEGTITLKDLYNLLYPDIIVPNSLIQLSAMFNIMNIDLTKPITIFDDLINSFFFDNSIYAINNLHIFNEFDHQYFYANNSYGLSRYNERLQEKKKTFNWNLFLKTEKIKNKVYDLHDVRKLEHKINMRYSLNFF